MPLDEAVDALRKFEEAWGTVGDPVEGFLVVTLFYVIAHPPSHVRGPRAFEAFVADLQAQPRVAERRAMLRRRYQRCFVEAAPQAARLVAAGVTRVKDLTRIDLAGWGFDHAWAKQVRRSRGLLTMEVHVGVLSLSCRCTRWRT
jgi:hypothetical protein